jgi:preprotein translocase subunit SecE
MSQIASISRFLNEVRAESRKVVWPDQKETVSATIMVVIMVLVISLFLWGVDSILSWLVKMVI